MKRYIVDRCNASVKASNELLTPYKMVGRGSDGREIRVGGEDEDECMYKLNQWAEAHGGLEWYSGLTDDNYRDGERIVESSSTIVSGSNWLSKQSVDQFAEAKKSNNKYTAHETKYEYYMRKRDEIPHKYEIGDKVELLFPNLTGEIVDVQFLPDELDQGNENFAWRYLLKVTDPRDTVCKPGEVYDFAVVDSELRPVVSDKQSTSAAVCTNVIRRH